MRRALAGLVLLLGCGGDPAPQPEPAPRPAAATVGTTERLDAPFEGIYSDTLRVVSVTFDEERGYRGVLEDNTVPGWSEPHAAALTAREGKLTGVLDDRYATELSLALDGDALQLETWRRGHENPRSHELARADSATWASALEAYDRAYPDKTVDTPRRKGELLAAKGEQLRESTPGDAAELYDAAATLLWPKAKLVAGVAHRSGLCWMPGANPDGSWDEASKRFARAATLRGEVDDAGAQAASLLNLGHCRNPAFNEAGDAKEAQGLYAQAADAATQGEEPAIFKRARREQAVCLARQAVALIGGKRSNMTPEAQALFERAHGYAKEAGDPKIEAKIGEWIGSPR